MIRAAIAATLLAATANAQEPPASIKVQGACSQGRLSVIRLVVPPSAEPTLVTIPIPPGFCGLET